MKTRLFSLIPALAVAVAGIVLLCRQRADIVALQQTEPRVLHSVSVQASAPLPPSPAVALTKAPSAPLTSGEARAAAFLAGLDEKARPLIEKSAREAAAAGARYTAGRLALLLGLRAEEQEALRQHLEKQDGPDNAAAREWIAEKGSPAQTAAVDAAEAARRTANVELEAQEAIFRLSRIVDLTPEQKDRLYAGFVSKAAAAPAESETEPLELRTAFTVKDTPDIADPAALARPLLTPEQLAFFNAAVEQEAKVIRESSQGVMGQLMPVLMSSLQEAAAEKE